MRYQVTKQYLVSVTLVVWVQCRYSQLVLADEMDRTNGAIRDIGWHLRYLLRLVPYRFQTMSYLHEEEAAAFVGI